MSKVKAALGVGPAVKSEVSSEYLLGAKQCFGGEILTITFEHVLGVRVAI